MAAETAIRLRRVRDVGDVLNDTFRFLRQNYRTLGKSLLLIVGPVIAVSSVAATGLQLLGFGLSPDVASGPSLLEPTPALIVVLGSSVIFGMVASALAVTVVNVFVVLYQDRGPDEVTVADVWSLTKKFFGRVFGSLLFFTLALVIAIPVAIIPCLGILAYMAGAVYFGVSLAPVMTVYIREDARLLPGMRRSRELVQDSWWPTLGVIFVALLVYVVLGTAVSIPYYMVLFFFGFNTVEGSDPGMLQHLALVVTNMFGAVAGVLFYSVPLTALAIQYFSLVERKERTGLLERIDALEPEDENRHDAHG